MKFTQVKGNTWCLEGKEFIPVYRIDERRCILLDSGWNWEREKLQAALEREGLWPIGVLGSHAHTDHLGNHGWLKETYGTRIWMSAGEALFANLESRKRHCWHIVSRMGTYFDSVEFTVDEIVAPEDGTVCVCDVPFSVYHTPGHSLDHLCITTPDGVGYLGDLVVDEEEMKRVEMPYHLSYNGARRSMEKMLETPRCEKYIVAHRGIVDDLDRVVGANIAVLDEIEGRMLDVLEEPLCWEDVLVRGLKICPMEVKTPHQEHAYREFINLIVTALEERGIVSIRMENGEKWVSRC